MATFTINSKKLGEQCFHSNAHGMLFCNEQQITRGGNAIYVSEETIERVSKSIYKKMLRNNGMI